MIIKIVGEGKINLNESGNKCGIYDEVKIFEEVITDLGKSEEGIDKIKDKFLELANQIKESLQESILIEYYLEVQSEKTERLILSIFKEKNTDLIKYELNHIYDNQIIMDSFQTNGIVWGEMVYDMDGIGEYCLYLDSTHSKFHLC